MSGRDDLVGRPQVGHDLGDLGALPGPGSRTSVGRVPSTLAVGREVADVRVVGLPVPIDAADPLLEAVRVERDVEVDQPMAVVLEVDAFARRIGGQQNADLGPGGVLVEAGTDEFALLGIRASLDDGDAFGLVPALTENRLDPVAVCRRTR